MSSETGSKEVGKKEKRRGERVHKETVKNL